MAVMKVLISAAEISSDVHGSRLIRAIRTLLSGEQETSEFFGIGGPMLKDAGLRTVVEAGNLRVMGSKDVISKLPAVYRALKMMEQNAIINRPDVAVVIDFPDFHFLLARRLRKLGIPLVYYIPPKIWVWRKYRLKSLARNFERVLCILPFEEQIYRDHGVDAVYIGNPLADELPLKLSKREARQKLSLRENQKVIVIMPGSRPAEIKRHSKLMMSAANSCALSLRKKGVIGPSEEVRVLVVLSSQADLESFAVELSDWRWRITDPAIDLSASVGNAHEALVAADAGIIKSGTSTLEAALLGCPHVVVYKIDWFTNWVFNSLIKYKGPVGLSNLVFNHKARAPFVFPEVLGKKAKASNIHNELLSIMTDVLRRDEVMAAISKVRERIFETSSGQTSESPSAKAAAEVIAVAKESFGDNSRSVGVVKTVTFCVGSFLWSLVNWLMRKLVNWGLFRRHRLDCRVVSVGNLQAGGTGKTPIAALLARQACERGLKTVILSRGYRGKWEKEKKGGIIAPDSTAPSAVICGDEPALLHDLAPKAWIGVGADRLKQYQIIRETMGVRPDLVILDDGFQHWKIERDVDLVAITSKTRKQVLFRDFTSAVTETDLLVWTKGKKRPSGFQGKTMVRLNYEIPEEVITKIADSPLWLVTGLADGANALALLKQKGLQIKRHIQFKDHAHYTESNIREISTQATNDSCRLVITGKDWVKWREYKQVLDDVRKEQIVVLEPQLVFIEGRELWSRILWES